MMDFLAILLDMMLLGECFSVSPATSIVRYFLNALAPNHQPVFQLGESAYILHNLYGIKSAAENNVC